MKEVSILSPKETDLQKVIAEVKSSLQDKELQSLADDVLSKVSTNGNNLSEILNDQSLQSTLQNLLQNKNLAELLNNPNLGSQIAGFLNSPGNAMIVEQLKAALSDSEKKKINSEEISESFRKQLKEELLSKYSQNKYEKQRSLIQSLASMTPPSKQKTLHSLYNLFFYKEIIEGSHVSHQTMPVEMEDD